jgi:hypothetical protein
MKKLSLLSLPGIILLSAFALINDANPLQGRWENTRMYQGRPMSLIGDFRADGTYSGFINKKVFVTGNYQVKHDTLFIYDITCNITYAGTYKIHFFGQDSLKFQVILDTCSGRREGTSGFLFKKLKK